VIDFNPDPTLRELAERTAAFVRETVIPYETDPRWGSHGPSDGLRSELVNHARAAGLLSPHVAAEYGGQGLSQIGRALVFEEAGYSMLGPVAMNIAAPDEGNAHLLEHVGSEAQKERWLRPHAAGELRTCFAMTEPSPGAGSDPSMLQTTAVRDGDEYVIDGRKWLITGADGAAVAIVMAKDGDGATMLLVPTDTPGFVHERTLDTLDSSFTGGHGVLRFDHVRVPVDAVLGEAGEGFRYAQVRLAPARLTHCMRWLGAARRAHDIAAAYAARREAFGQVLGAHEGVGFMLADNEMDLQTARLHIWHTAWLLDRGDRGSEASSVAKTVCSEAVWRVADRSMQILGGLGVTADTAVARIFRDVRAFRIYDGPSEVHRWSIARRVLKRAGAVTGRSS
jgi:alkylation response protein AidB-like acyl-CoA dehydrogenase